MVGVIVALLISQVHLIDDIPVQTYIAIMQNVALYVKAYSVF
jgi:hypothetical protein